jgi:lipoprotein-releasing system ATP-binding protein
MLLKVADISKSYRSRFGRIIREILRGTSLLVEKGEKIAVAGPSGSGKTTLLNLIGALDFPDRGEILFNDVPLSVMTARQLAELRNREIGFIFQSHHLLPQLTLWENILVPVLPGNEPRNLVYRRAAELLEETGLWEIRHQRPGELSGGECQRTAVVRALINRPSLVLADEPTGSLDSENAGVLIDLLVRLSKMEQSALVVVTHSMAVASAMDKIYTLGSGQLKRADPGHGRPEQGAPASDKNAG